MAKHAAIIRPKFEMILDRFEEELKGGGNVKSTFLTDIDRLFETALTADEIEGVILNPWNRTIMLDKYLIKVILGKNI